MGQQIFLVTGFKEYSYMETEAPFSSKALQISRRLVITLVFTRETLDIVDNRYREMKGFYLIMNNASIRLLSEVSEIIENRNKDYKCIYLPPYYSEIN